MNGELRALRDRIASAIADEAKRRTIPPAWPAGPGGSGATMQEVADAVMAVVQPELDRLTERIPYREGETEEDYLYRQVARWRSEAWQARGKLKAAGSERDQLKVAAQAETRAANRWMAEANQAEAAIARVRALVHANAERADCGAGWLLDPAKVLAALDQHKESNRG